MPGWAATTVDDVAIVTAGESRWHNIYVRTVEHPAGYWLVEVSGVAFGLVAKITFESGRLTELLAVRSTAELSLEAPEIENFQDQACFEADEPISIAPGKGLLLRLHRRSD